MEQILTEILKTTNSVVMLCKDAVTGSYCIGIRTDKDLEWKYISKRLYDLLIEELSTQKGNR